MRCDGLKPAKQIGGRFEPTKGREFIRCHIQTGRTELWVCTSAKKDANRFDVTGVFRRSNAKLQGAAQRGLTPICWGNLVRVGPRIQKALYLSGVTCPASVVEELPLHSNQNNVFEAPTYSDG
jgi:hypothetical protein